MKNSSATLPYLYHGAIIDGNAICWKLFFRLAFVILYVFILIFFND